MSAAYKAAALTVELSPSVGRTGVEPATLCLKGTYSAIELPASVLVAGAGVAPAS